MHSSAQTHTAPIGKTPYCPCLYSTTLVASLAATILITRANCTPEAKKLRKLRSHPARQHQLRSNKTKTPTSPLPSSFLFHLPNSRLSVRSFIRHAPTTTLPSHTPDSPLPSSAANSNNNNKHETSTALFSPLLHHPQTTASSSITAYVYGCGGVLGIRYAHLVYVYPYTIQCPSL